MWFRHNTYDRKKKLADVFILFGVIGLAIAGSFFVIGPNPYSFSSQPSTFQVVLTDANNKEVKYNVAVTMTAQSFSANIPITVEAEAIRIPENRTLFYFVPEQMYVIFIGSHQIPTVQTGLLNGYYYGQIILHKVSDSPFVRYAGTGQIGYDQGGSFPIYLTGASVSITEPIDVSNIPHQNIEIGSVEATRSIMTYQDERLNLGLSVAVIALTIVSLRPVIHSVIDDWL